MAVPVNPVSVCWLVTTREIGRMPPGVERLAKEPVFTRVIFPDGAEVVRKRLFHFLDKIGIKQSPGARFR